MESVLVKILVFTINGSDGAKAYPLTSNVLKLLDIFALTLLISFLISFFPIVK